MKKFCRAGTVVVLGALLAGSAGTANAQFAEDVLRFSQPGLGVGAKWLSFGNAAVGQVDDYSALFWNPAGLANLRSYEFSFGLSYLGYGNEATYLGNTTSAYSSAVNLNSIGLAVPVPTVQGSLTIALGFGRYSNFKSIADFGGFNRSNSIVQSMLDQDLPYAIYLAGTDSATGLPVPYVTGNVQQNALVNESGGVNNWSFGAAIDIAKDLAIGATFNYASGSYEYDREFEETDSRNFYAGPPPDDFHRFRYSSTINSSLSGVNGLFGVMYRAKGLMRFGFTFRTPTYFWIREDFGDRGVSQFDPTSPDAGPFEADYPGVTEYEITTPMIISGGAALNFFDFLTVAADAEYTDWTQMKFETSNATLQEENRLIKRIYRPTVNLRGGAELNLLGSGVRLRAGLIWNPSPYEDDPVEFDKVYLTAGAGFEFSGNVVLEIAYARGFWETFRDNYYLPNVSEASRTTESVTTDNANITLKARF
jgi:long-subunit fatty acid transport protein